MSKQSVTVALATVLLAAAVGCDDAAPATPEVAREAPEPSPAEDEPPHATETVVAGRWIWDAPPFPELAWDEAARHCDDRGARLPPRDVLMGEHARHEAIRVSGTFWSADRGAGAGEAWAVELDVPTGSGEFRTGMAPRPVESALGVRCMRENPAAPADPQPSVGRCDTIERDSECMEHGPEAFATLSPQSRSTECTAFRGGTYALEPCPPEDRVGRCPGLGGQTTHYYARGGSPYTAATAREACGAAFEPAAP